MSVIITGIPTADGQLLDPNDPDPRVRDLVTPTPPEGYSGDRNCTCSVCYNHNQKLKALDAARKNANPAPPPAYPPIDLDNLVINQESEEDEGHDYDSSCDCDLCCETTHDSRLDDGEWTEGCGCDGCFDNKHEAASENGEAVEDCECDTCTSINAINNHLAKCPKCESLQYVHLMQTGTMMHSTYTEEVSDAEELDVEGSSYDGLDVVEENLYCSNCCYTWPKPDNLSINWV